MATETVKVPELGDTDDVEIIELLIDVGQSVAVDDSLLVLESDKAAMEVPAPLAGVVKSIAVKLGDKVNTGTEICTVEVQASAAPEAPAVPEQPPAQPAPAIAATAAHAPVSTLTVPPPISDAPNHPPLEGGSVRAAHRGGDTPSEQPTTEQPIAKPGKPAYAGPAVRKLARELGVALEQVTGSGLRGRITKGDLQDFVKARMGGGAPTGAGFAPAAGGSFTGIPDIDFSRFGEVEKVPLSKIQKITATNLQRSWQHIPHVAQFHEADVTDLEEFRAQLKPEAERRGVKLTFLPFLLKACAKALQEYPQFNVSLHSSGEYLWQKKYIHLGVAVATDSGLVVPVVRDADRKSIWELAAEVIDLSSRARSRKLSREEMEGACFTVSSLGAIGGTGYIAVINPPEVGILAVGKTTWKPVYKEGGAGGMKDGKPSGVTGSEQGGAFHPRKMLPLTLSYDHKAVNGIDGGHFITHLVKLLSDIRHLSL